MELILRLMFEFFKTGLFAVGGGLATLPFLYEMSAKTGWFSTYDIADMIAISESTPGAIGINMSTYAGFTTAGPFGGVCASLGLALPSLIIIIVIAKFLNRFEENKYVQRAFYGLRPASIAMITAAGLNVAEIALLDWTTASFSFFMGDPFNISGPALNLPAIILAVCLFIGMKKLKWHPVVFLAISAVVGIVLL